MWVQICVYSQDPDLTALSSVILIIFLNVIIGLFYSMLCCAILGGMAGCDFATWAVLMALDGGQDRHPA